MPQNLEAELEDFFRWLATMPQHRSDYRRDPESVMDYAKLSDQVREALHHLGKDRVIARAKEKLDDILNSPEAKKESTFGRDFSASGFGGTVLKKEPADPE